MTIKEGRQMKGCITSTESLSKRPAPPAPNKAAKQMTKDPAAEWQAGYDACAINAAKLYLQGKGPWKLDEIGIDEDDYLVKCFASYRNAVIEECAKALEADAKLCDCAALEERECGCGAWCEWKSITSARAVEIVRAVKESK